MVETILSLRCSPLADRRSAATNAAPEARTIRNGDWQHLNNRDIISMPDTWEYPWYASWDLAFQAVTFALIDPEFAKQQLLLLTHEWFMHPNGSLPAYEWAFGDVNPPVHAWAAWRVFRMDAGCVVAGLRIPGACLPQADDEFHRLGEPAGCRGTQRLSGRLPRARQYRRVRPQPETSCSRPNRPSDGTSWMAMYTLNMMRISLELATRNHVYEATATKFFEHFLAIAEAMTRQNGRRGLWDEVDRFYHNVLQRPDGSAIPLRFSPWSGCFRCSRWRCSNPKRSRGVQNLPNGYSGC